MSSTIFKKTLTDGVIIYMNGQVLVKSQASDISVFLDWVEPIRCAKIPLDNPE